MKSKPRFVIAMDEWSDAAREAAAKARAAKTHGSKESHQEAAAAHKKAEEGHEIESKARGEHGKPSRTGSHAFSKSEHNSAAFYHQRAADTHGTPDYADNAKNAHRNSSSANSSSEKVRKAGENYEAPKVESKEKTPLTERDHSTRRIERYLRENRIKMR